MMKFIQEIRSHPYRAWKCLNLCFIYMGIGLVSSFEGPTMLDLKLAANATMHEIAFIIPINASGHLTGSVIGAFILTYLDHQPIILVSLLVMSTTFTILPCCRSLWTIYIISFANGVSTGFLIDIGNVWILYMFGKENTPFMQFAHFAYGLGCFAGPFIAEPFLLPDDKQAHHSTAHKYRLDEIDLKHYTADDLRIQYGYGIGGMINFAFFILFLVTFFFQTSNKPHPSRLQVKSPAAVRSTRTVAQPSTSKCASKQATDSTESCKTSVSTLVDRTTNSDQEPQPCSSSTTPTLSVYDKGMIVFVAALFDHVTYGLELSFGILLPVYAVKSPLALSKSTASFLTSCYWASFTFPKLLAAFCTSFMPIKSIIWIELIILLTANLILVPFGGHHEWAMWLGTGLIGVGVSAIFPCLLGYLENLFPVDSKITSLFTAGSCVGELTLPLLVGLYIEQFPDIFLYITLLYSILSVIFFVLLLLIVKHAKRKSELTLPITGKEIG